VDIQGHGDIRKTTKLLKPLKPLETLENPFQGISRGSKSISGFKLQLLDLLIPLKWVFKVFKGFQDISSNLLFS
jgi:hypothetical protein